jgi:hypothetical protein
LVLDDVQVGGVSVVGAIDDGAHVETDES